MIILSYAKICIKNTFFRLKDSKNLKIQKNAKYNRNREKLS